MDNPETLATLDQQDKNNKPTKNTTQENQKGEQHVILSKTWRYTTHVGNWKNKYC
jgi:hypothetical protein